MTVDSTPNIADGKYKTKEFLAKFPLGYLPAFEGVDGSLIQESAAISDYRELTRKQQQKQQQHTTARAPTFYDETYLQLSLS